MTVELLTNDKKIRSKRRKLWDKKYEKTKKGFLMRMYRNMQSRIEGVQKKKHHLYSGKELLPRSDFYNFALSSGKFHELFNEWVKNSYDRKLTPSIDRIDSTKGYILENIEWVTHSENSRRGGVVSIRSNGTLNRKLKLTKEQFEFLKEWKKQPRWNRSHKVKELMAMFNCSTTVIYQAVNSVSYKNIYGDST